MEHIPWVFIVFQTHSDKCRFRTEAVRGGWGLGGRARWVLVRSLRVGAGAGKISQIPADTGRV